MKARGDGHIIYIFVNQYIYINIYLCIFIFLSIFTYLYIFMFILIEYIISTYWYIHICQLYTTPKTNIFAPEKNSAISLKRPLHLPTIHFRLGKFQLHRGSSHRILRYCCWLLVISLLRSGHYLEAWILQNSWWKTHGKSKKKSHFGGLVGWLLSFKSKI